MRRYPPFLLILAVLLPLDQLTKRWVMAKLALHQSIPVLGDLFRITYVLNRGGIFGIGSRGDHPLLFIVVAFVALLFMLLYLPRVRETRTLIGLSLVFSGAVGNLMDRLRLGAVVDFLDFGYRSWRWPAFNLADAAITVGVGLLLWGALRSR